MIFKKKIVFITTTRADFGKIKNVISELYKNKKFDPYIFVTGMHMEKKFGSTWVEISKIFKNIKIKKFKNKNEKEGFDVSFSNTIREFSKFIKKVNPNLIILHGDRLEALAAAIVGSINQVLIAHIEGGERSGTVDEHIRHSISKLSHLHFVSNIEAKKRLIKLGEDRNKIFIAGSPDIDLMVENKLPSFEEVKKRYNLKFNNYIIFLFHPVTGELNKLEKQIDILIRAVKQSKKNAVIIYPNNDLGNDLIIRKINSNFKDKKIFRIFLSMRFEYFLRTLKESLLIIGNSSAGFYEAPVFGVPSINVGNRQENRGNFKSIYNVNFNQQKITSLIRLLGGKKFKSIKIFGKGNSAKIITKILLRKSTWDTNFQKQIKY
jgi:UDP-N-acetylglucosamine 2-epimerase (hydrolysing)